LKALVTGGAGFIGSHVVDRLIEENIETYVLVSGTRSTDHQDIINKEANIVKGNLLDCPSLLRATHDVDYVFHLAGLLSHYCEKYPQYTILTNVTGTWNLKQACAKNKVKRIIFASSCFVYGNVEKLQGGISEGHPTNPKGLYGATKLAAEKVLQAVHPVHVPYTILRLFNVYGPRQYPDRYYTSVMSTWIMRALKKLPLEIHGDGTQQLDFVYVEDVADAFITSVNVATENRVFNVGSGTATSMNTLAALINKYTLNPEAPYYNPSHAPYFRYMCADIDAILSRTCWYPKTTLKDGIKQTIEFYRRMI